MSFFDSAKEKAEGLAADNPDKLEEFSDQGLERGGDAADSASGGRFGEHIDQGQVAADERIGSGDGENPPTE
ncbi:antitoxin [Knoellia sp. CPCC 206435]|uniref:antitoxin n=1 Tax=Knoellia terrae TaxID=3404797 RepID=UPI003B43732A